MKRNMLRAVRRGVSLLLCAAALCSVTDVRAAHAEELPKQLIHDVLLSSLSYPSEFGAAGWTLLGQAQSGREWSLYLSASVGGYGFMGGYCTLRSGWSGPCTIVLQKVNGEWRLKEFLEIEDYSEIPGIMPHSAEQKFFGNDFEEETAMLNAEIASHLRDLCRTEPLGDYADAGGELANLIVAAENLLLGGEPWPLGCTTVETEEDGVRMYYAKAWEPDPGAPEEIVTTLPNGLRYEWGGTSGTILYTKTRKDDGAILQTITAHASPDEMTVLYRDGGGSILYTLQGGLDENGLPTYFQPTVVREGDCRIDTTLFERRLRDLPGERHSEWTVEARADISETERFTLLRDSCYHRLCHETQENGVWQADWTNDQLIGDCCEALTLDFRPGPGTQQTGRFTRAISDQLLLYSADAESPDVYIEFSQNGGVWQVDTYNNRYNWKYAYLLDGCMLVQNESLVSGSHAMYVPGSVERRADRFDPVSLFDASDKLRGLDFDLIRHEAYVHLGLTDSYADIAGAEALYVSSGVKKSVSVYAYPDKHAPRAANGKASVSLNGPIAFLCKEGDWLMVLYEMDKGRHRTGWVCANDLLELQEIARFVMPAQFERRRVTALQETALWDDPLNVDGQLCTLKKGAEIDVLSDTAALFYVEANVNGKRYRGYVERGFLSGY